MIIGALIALLFMGGSGASLMTASLEQLSEQLPAVVKDEATLKQAMAVAENITEVDEKWAKTDGKQEEALGKLMADYQADSQEFSQLLEQTQLDRTEYTDALIASRFELKDILSREEWAEVFAKESK